MKLLLNWVQENLFSDNGFILTDPLICIVIVSLMVIMVSSAVQSLYKTNNMIQQNAAESESEYRQQLSQISSCEKSCIQESEDQTGL